MMNHEIRQDRVDEIRKQWSRVRPELDTWPVEVVIRVGRTARYFDAGMEALFRTYGMTRASWDIVAALRRVGPPYRLSPTNLYRTVMRTSGAMTRRIDHLEGEGFVTRVPDPSDRRGILVELTPLGLTIVDEIAEAHMSNERELLATLTHDEQRDLAALLKKLLLAFEQSHPSSRAAPRKWSSELEELPPHEDRQD